MWNNCSLLLFLLAGHAMFAPATTMPAFSARSPEKVCSNSISGLSRFKRYQCTYCGTILEDKPFTNFERCPQKDGTSNNRHSWREVSGAGEHRTTCRNCNAPFSDFNRIENSRCPKSEAGHQWASHVIGI